jgi:cell division protein ZapB
MSEPTPTPSSSESSKKSTKTTLVIIGLILIIIVQGVIIYFDSQTKQTYSNKLTSTEQQLDSTVQRLKEIRSELEFKIAEVQKLGGNVADLEKAKAELDAELRRNKKATGKEIAALQDKVQGYEELLNRKDEEIAKLKSVNSQLMSENTNLKTVQNQLHDSTRKLVEDKEQLADKVKIASQLKAENVSIAALNDRDKERESPFRSKQIAKLKVTFNLAENAVAPIEGKTIMIRIVDENGQVIFDVNRGSGTFIYNGKEEFFTASQEILFDNTRQKLSYIYEKGSDYASGKYLVEIYCDDYRIGQGNFVVK